jgi:hypothetical protein
MKAPRRSPITSAIQIDNLDPFSTGFWAQVDSSGGSEACWPWLGHRTKKGYGKVQAAGALRQAHRVAYVMAVGDVPPNLHIDHLCRNPPCCNPAHGEAVSNAENLRRSPILRAAALEGIKKLHARRAAAALLAPAKPGPHRSIVCKRGHYMLGPNLRFMPNQAVPSGLQRVCRECGRMRDRARYDRGTPPTPVTGPSRVPQVSGDSERPISRDSSPKIAPRLLWAP